jgi:Na+/proline symporter
MRLVMVVFTGIVLAFALGTSASIFEMVENAYKITLVAAFIPLLAGLYWKKATNAGALASIASGIGVWLTCEFLQPNAIWPPQLLGLIASAVAMIAVSLLTQHTAQIHELQNH